MCGSYIFSIILYLEVKSRNSDEIKMKRRSTNRLTLKHVAEKLSVSTATLSNAFNRPSQLSKELRDEILQECRNMGYAGPHAQSRNKRASKTRVIGVMLSNQLSYSFSDPVANQMLQGLSQIFEEPEFNLLVMPSRRGVKQLSGIESFVDGFIIYGPPAQERLDEIRYHSKSIIAIDFEMEGVTSINIENRKASQDIASHAFKHKPEHAAILGLRIADTDKLCTLNDAALLSVDENITVQRLQGFQNAAFNAEVYIPPEHIWNIPDNNKALAYQAAIQALQLVPRPSLLLCMSDRCALSAIRAAHDLGLEVPRDVMITGFDGIEEAEQNRPSLTTVAQQSIEKGKIAAEIFLGLREEKSVVLHSPLRIRESCPSID